MAGKGRGPLLKVMEEKMNIGRGNKTKEMSPRQRSSTICSERGILEVQEEDSSQSFDLANYEYHKVITLEYDMFYCHVRFE